jgi:probable selenium-dependent hydroxylase accessory protein YqeC
MRLDRPPASTTPVTRTLANPSRVASMTDDRSMSPAPPLDLWSALDLDAARPPVVAIVGGGGKTSLLFALGREARSRGARAILSGTTRFTFPGASSADAPPLVLFAEDAALEVGAALESQPVIVVSSGREPQQRFAALTPLEVAALASLPGLGLLALEADGSRMHPFKAPAPHEPVISASATHVVVMLGIDALGAALDAAHVHRPEVVRALLEGTPNASAERATIEVLTRVLLHPSGGRKDVEARSFAVLVNKADLNPSGAEALADALIEAGAPRVVVTSLRDTAAPVRGVLVSGA